MSKFGGGIGVPSKEKRLKEAAEIHLRLGQIQRYCELMVELGEVSTWTVTVRKYIICNTNIVNNFKGKYWGKGGKRDCK